MKRSAQSLEDRRLQRRFSGKHVSVSSVITAGYVVYIE